MSALSHPGWEGNGEAHKKIPEIAFWTRRSRHHENEPARVIHFQLPYTPSTPSALTLNSFAVSSFNSLLASWMAFCDKQGEGMRTHIKLKKYPNVIIMHISLNYSSFMTTSTLALNSFIFSSFDSLA
jgi:hypothetical protein